MITLLLTVFLVVLISAICSMTEAALYSVPWTYIENLRKQGSATGELLYQLRSRIDQPIAAVLTLNTVANTAGAAIAGAVAANVLGADNTALFAAGLTILILALGEILPKTLGVAHACGVECPKVAPLAAVEVVNPKMPCTVDAEELRKMNAEGKITGCVVDGPLSMDIAIDPEAAQHKGAQDRPAAGHADILLFPDIQAGNLVYKTLVHTAECKNGCILTGTKVPAILTTMDEERSSALALVENIQRCDLNFFEEAAAIQKLMKMGGYTQQAVAKKLGKNQSTIANKLRLLQFSEPVREAILAANLTERHARALLNLNEQGDEPLLQAIKAIQEREMNVAQAEKYIAQLEGKQDKPKEKRLFIVKDLRIFLNSIDKALETMKLSGIRAKTQMQEENDEVVYTIRIPKESAYAKSKH